MTQNLNHVSGNSLKQISGKASNDQAHSREQSVMELFQDLLDAQLDVQPDGSAALISQAVDPAAPVVQTSAGQILPFPDLPGGNDLPQAGQVDGNPLPANLPIAPADFQVMPQDMPQAALFPAQMKDLASSLTVQVASAAKKTALADLPGDHEAASPVDFSKTDAFSTMLPQALAAMPRNKTDAISAEAVPGRHDGVVIANPSPAVPASPLVNLAVHYPTASAMPAAAAQITTPLDSPAWGQALEQKVVWMVGERQQAVNIQLNPPHLGPLEVQLQIENDQATVIFSSPHGAVKEAVEAAMPRLQHSFEQQGMSFSGTCLTADPGSQFSQQRQASRQPEASQPGFGRDQVQQDIAATPRISGAKAQGEGLVNLFV